MGTSTSAQRAIMDQRQDAEDEPLFTYDQSVIDDGSSMRMTIPSNWVDLLDLDGTDSIIVHVHQDRLEVRVSDE